MTQELRRNKNRQYIKRRPEIELLLKVLRALKKAPMKKYAIMCLLTTNSTTVTRTIDTLLTYDLIYYLVPYNKTFDITNKGLELLSLLEGIKQ